MRQEKTGMYSLDQCDRPALASRITLDIALENLEWDVVATQDLGQDQPARTGAYYQDFVAVICLGHGNMSK